MLEYDRIYISEGIDTDKTNASEECDVCHYWYFKDIGFKYEAMSFDNVVILFLLKEVVTEFTFGI